MKHVRHLIIACTICAFTFPFTCTSHSRADQVNLYSSAKGTRAITGATFWYRFHYSTSGRLRSLALRPLGGKGADHWMGFSFSIIKDFHITAFAVYSERNEAVFRGGGFEAGKLFRFKSYRLYAAFGVLGEESSGSGIYARGEALWLPGPFKLGGSVHTEKVFKEGRDAVDLILSLNAGLNITSNVSVEGEYLVQDIEALWEEEEAEGGMRQAFFAALAFDFSPLRLKLKPGYITGRESGPAFQTELYLTF